MVLAANSVYGPLLCYWDQPDSHLTLSEVGHFILKLRAEFDKGGQLLATSHNPETIRHFSDESTIVLRRNSHLEPPVAQVLKDLEVHGDVVTALIAGDLTG